MIFWLAIAAAVGTAVCNGFAAILQKMGADKHVSAGSGHVSVFLKLFRDWPYLLGTALDLIAWVLTLVAVQTLPLFVVQPITALSVVITVWVERVFFKRRITRGMMAAVGVILLGLALLASSAVPESNVQTSQTVQMAIILSPLLILAGGLMFIRNTKHYATIVLGGLSGAAFGATAIVGRMLDFSPPFWNMVYQPLFLSLIAYGAVGVWLFAIALQRHHATIVNAAMISTETVIPTIVGILALGDRPAGGAWEVVIAGIGLTVAGTLLITRDQTRRKKPRPAPQTMEEAAY